MTLSVLNNPILTSDGSHTVRSSIYGETYHSTHGAINESEHVFIQAGIDYYLSNIDNNTSSQSIHIFEMGMGTGLNALLSAKRSNAMLHIDYTTVEAHQLPPGTISKLNYGSLLDFNKGQQIFDKIHHVEWGQQSKINDHFRILKLNMKLEDLELKQEYDIIFYDAFGPKTQPHLWTIDRLQQMYNALRPNGVFVTYCAMGQFKRDLNKMGFEVQSIPGPPGKREMTRGIKK